MTSTREIATVLRTLDPAPSPADPTSPRARRDLQRILAADPSPNRRHQPRTSSSAFRSWPRNRSRTVRRVALAASVLAVTAGVVALPAVTGGDQAFASWTRVPEGLSASERGDAAASCRQEQQGGAGAGYTDQLKNAQPAIVERRGVWTTVILTAADGFSALCITDDSSHLFGKDMIGLVGTPTNHLPIGPRELVAMGLGTGTMKAGDISVAAGAAGPEVIAVVYHSRDHGRVDATVSGGRFALWFPGDELKDESTNPVEVDVTYLDSSTSREQLTL